MSKLTKKVSVGVATGVLSLSIITGSAFAYKDEWTAKINTGVSKFANVLFGGDIEKQIDSYGNSEKGKFSLWGTGVIKNVQSTLQAFKTSEIERGKKAIDDKISYDKSKLQDAVNMAVKNAEDTQATKTDAQVKTENDAIDKSVDDFLNQVNK